MNALRYAAAGREEIFFHMGPLEDKVVIGAVNRKQVEKLR